MTMAVTYLLEVQSSIARRDTGIIKLNTSAGEPPSALTLLERFAALRNRRPRCATCSRNRANLVRDGPAEPFISTRRSFTSSRSGLALDGPPLLVLPSTLALICRASDRRRFAVRARRAVAGGGRAHGPGARVDDQRRAGGAQHRTDRAGAGFASGSQAAATRFAAIRILDAMADQRSASYELRQRPRRAPRKAYDGAGPAKLARALAQHHLVAFDLHACEFAEETLAEQRLAAIVEDDGRHASTCLVAESDVVERHLLRP